MAYRPRHYRFMVRFLAFAALLFANAASCPPLLALELPAAERAKIEALIKHVAELQDAKFVRNGVEYDAATAARFLRGKWEANTDSIRTVADFIAKAASMSSTSGKPYLIRFKDGKEQKSGEYLHAKLKNLEKQER